MEEGESRRRRRRRGRQQGLGDGHEHDAIHNGMFSSREQKLHLTLSSYFIMFFIFSWAFFLTRLIQYQLPNALLVSDERDNPGRFISEYAFTHVQNLTKLGPRPAGSFENEVLAVNLLTRELNMIAKKASRSHRITIQYQKASGAFSLQFLDGMTNVYKNVQNIILKIGPPTEAKHSILMNCHFDSVPDSPGGSDNAAGCAVMLEILRVISISHSPLRNNIIFLFNGAEENLLQGSHGFITQHQWAKNIKAFINLEACGAGGRELLFQAGPENPWLMEVYASSVPYPLASTLAQEIFQAGVIPGDTDYRIFRDYGKIPGLDFAWAINGYVYHTKHDNAENVPIKSLQRTGDNLLPLAIKLANMNYSKEIPQHGNLVFFDVLGLELLRIPESSSRLINLAIILISVYLIKKNANRMGDIHVCSKAYYIAHLVSSCCLTLFSWIVTLAFVFIYSQIIAFLGRSMSWYARPGWLIFLYALLSLWILIKFSGLAGSFQKKKLLAPICCFCLQVDTNQVVWTFALLITTVFGFRSSIFISFVLGFIMISNFIMHTFRNSGSLSGIKGRKYIYMYFAIMLIPVIQLSYMVNGALLVIIPIFGRSGSSNIEGLVALMVFSMSVIIFNFMSSHLRMKCGVQSSIHFLFIISLIAFETNTLFPWFISSGDEGIDVIPLTSLLEDYRVLTKLLSRVVFIAFLALILTPMGFPYSSDQHSPAPQRYMVVHVEQIIHGSDGKVLSDAGGLWIVDLDMNSPNTVSKFVPEIEQARKVDTCDTLLYCGLPYLIPVQSMISQTHWISTQKPVISIATNLTLNYVEQLDEEVKRYHFVANGPDHMSLIISPLKGSELISWSFLNEKPLPGPQWNGRNTYFVYMSYASNPEPWIFTIDIKSEKNHGAVMDIALTGHFVHGAHQRSVKLNKLLSQFPPWTVTSGWVATYSSYIF